MKKGLLVRGVTRGDGTTGEVVTANVRTINAIPLRVDATALKKLRLPEDFEVRGEIVMPLRAFEKLNQRQEEQGGKRYANPRNVAAGSVRVLDPGITGSRQLDFYAYYLLAGGREPMRRHSEALEAFAKTPFQNLAGLGYLPLD